MELFLEIVGVAVTIGALYMGRYYGQKPKDDNPPPPTDEGNQ